MSKLFSFARQVGAITLVLAIGAAAQAADPLPSWNDGPAKQAIIAFVEEVTKEGGSGFVAPPERIATFDNDGTLWSEQPIFQLLFAIDRVKALASSTRSGRRHSRSRLYWKAT